MQKKIESESKSGHYPNPINKSTQVQFLYFLHDSYADISALLGAGITEV